MKQNERAILSCCSIFIMYVEVCSFGVAYIQNEFDLMYQRRRISSEDYDGK